MLIIKNLFVSFIISLTCCITLLGIVLFFSRIAKSDEAAASYGLGVLSSAKTRVSEVKFLDVAYRKELLNPWSLQFKLSAWADTSGNPDRKDSTYISVGPQYTVRAGYVEIRNGISIGMITTPDIYLGGRFPQFNPELYIGIRDKEGVGFGFKYNHVSSGGIFNPNTGRDAVMLELSQRW